VYKNGASFPDAAIDRQEDLTQISCGSRYAEIRDRKTLVRRRNVRTQGFLRQNGIVRNQFARLGQIDEVSNANLEKSIDLLACFNRVFVSRVFASEKFYAGRPNRCSGWVAGEFQWAYEKSGVQELQKAARRLAFAFDSHYAITFKVLLGKDF
jgi:hypothetical protein